MRKTLPPEIEACRTAGPPDSGPYGAFALIHPETGRSLRVIVSDGRDWGQSMPAPPAHVLATLPPAAAARAREIWGDAKEITLPPPAWEHVSARAQIGVPNWREMSWLKGVFWEPEETVVQFHPAESEYVNTHPDVLHLWRCPSAPFVLPPRAAV